MGDKNPNKQLKKKKEVPKTNAAQPAVAATVSPAPAAKKSGKK